jgi:KISS1 receptor
MVDRYYITVIFQNFLYGLILLFAFIYSCLILFIRRFRHRNNIFILNICLSIIAFSIYFVIYFTMSTFVPQLLWVPNLCSVLYYVYCIVNITIAFSFISFTVHRFCSIVYHIKPFFKTQRWVLICIASQRIIELILALPCLLKRPTVSITALYIF